MWQKDVCVYNNIELIDRRRFFSHHVGICIYSIEKCHGYYVSGMK